MQKKDIEDILTEYLEKIVPSMLEQNYHLYLVKGGPDYPHLSEQSHFSHIINGIMGLTQVLGFLIESNATFGIDEQIVRKAFALFTIHEVHKNKKIEKIGTSEFSIPLEYLQAEYEKLGLSNFAAVDTHLMRAANVHKRSTKHGDMLITNDPVAEKIWLLVRIADTIASIRAPDEAQKSLGSYLADFSPVFAPKPVGQHALYYHQIKNVRGVLTNAIHQAVARYLADRLKFFPLLFFAAGTLYLGPASVDKETVSDLIPAIANVVLRSLTQGSSADAIRDGMRRQKFDFESYVYAFASVEDLLQVVHEDTLTAKPNPRIALDEIEGLASRRKELPAGWGESVEERLGIRLLDPKEHKTFNELWSLVQRYLLYVDTLVRDLAPTENRPDWFLRVFDVPSPYADNLRQEAATWARGGVGKYVLVIAYHFLRGPDFADRPAEALPFEDVLSRLHRRVLAAMSRMDTQAGRHAAVAQLGLQQDLEAYLRESLYISFTPTSQLDTDSLADYVSPKRKGHTGKICSICNRYSEYTDELRTGILDDFGRVFSNRVLPAIEAPQSNRLWCPVCQMEAILRKISGMGLPAQAHYKNSRRIYIYVLPTYSFTPEHLRLFNPLLEPFHHVTSLPVRDYGQDWGLPHYWLERRTLDPQWLDELKNVLQREANKIAGWGGKFFVRERVLMGRIQGQPHYYLITWEKAARDKDEDAHIATRTEAWAKAIFAAAVIHGMTGCKVYVTERPYLPVTDPADLKATIILDSPPPALRGLLGEKSDTISLYGREKGKRSGIEQVLDLSAALWTITANVHTPDRHTKDKYIAERLGALNTSPLAGATFYKEFARLNGGKSPDLILAKACEILLDIQGGELMDLVEKIARKSLEIALPLFKTSGRGKARRYELIFREAISAMRKAQQAIPEMMKAALGDRQPSPQSIAELKMLTSGTLLKGLERRQGNHRGEIFVRAWGEDLSRLVEEFVNILVDELYLGRAGGSFAHFLRLENQLADGIYYYIDRHLSQFWDEYKQQKVPQITNNSQNQK
jgi:hypothetical protein